jgi:hypothetical protein
LDNFGEGYYSAKNYSEKWVILRNIANSISNFGFNFTELEIERRLKNMRTHYRRKKEDLQRGLVAKTEWEYYPVLDKIMQKINKNQEPILPFNLSETSTKQDDKYVPAQVKLENRSSDEEEEEQNEMPIDMYVKMFCEHKKCKNIKKFYFLLKSQGA